MKAAHENTQFFSACSTSKSGIRKSKRVTDRSRKRERIDSVPKNKVARRGARAAMGVEIFYKCGGIEVNK
jgi:hypothetical protein